MWGLSLSRTTAPSYKPNHPGQDSCRNNPASGAGVRNPFPQSAPRGHNDRPVYMWGLLFLFTHCTHTSLLMSPLSSLSLFHVLILLLLLVSCCLSSFPFPLPSLALLLHPGSAMLGRFRRRILADVIFFMLRTLSPNFHFSISPLLVHLFFCLHVQRILFFFSSSCTISRTPVLL